MRNGTLTDGDRYKNDPFLKERQLDVADALRMLFEDPETDMAMAQTVPVAEFTS